MSLSLGVDPDLHYTAFAILDGEKVMMVGLTATPSKIRGMVAVSQTLDRFRAIPWPLDAVDRAAIEVPQVYAGSRSRADPADLINLALVSGGVHTVLGDKYPACQRAFVIPREWKGQVPKHIHHKRICEALKLEYTTERERVLVKWPEKTVVHGNVTPTRAQHVLDAVGLALWAQQRRAERHLLEPVKP